MSRYVGLSKKHNRWKALIKVHGKRKELGSFTSEEAAARCYDRHAVLAWGARYCCKHLDMLLSNRFSSCLACLCRLVSRCPELAEGHHDKVEKELSL